MEQKAVFLDRDGVINRERGEHTWRISDFEILSGVPEALAELAGAGWSLVVITNQSGIGLGLYDHADVHRLHELLRQELEAIGVHLSGIFYCPHHPRQGKCLCRKPGSLLFEKAVARFGIDPGRSVMIGDRERDMQAAETLGIRGILVEANSALLPLVRKELLKT
jgi:D-glycero-D-manno-heptose 1,7-bisphosphate phosphatase